jgi:aryl carrier-like protein
MFKARRKIDDVLLSSPLSREIRKQLTDGENIFREVGADSVRVVSWLAFYERAARTVAQ